MTIALHRLPSPRVAFGFECRELSSTTDHKDEEPARQFPGGEVWVRVPRANGARGPEGGGPRPENDDEEDPGGANDDEDLEGARGL